MNNNDWNRHASNLLKAELKLAGIGYDGLISRLNELGIDQTYKGIANRINRGTFTFAFFLQCMVALKCNNVRIENRIDEPRP